MSAPLKAAAHRLQSWIKNDAIPLWLERGLDPQTQAHYERLLPSGAPDLESSVRGATTKRAPASMHARA